MVRALLPWHCHPHTTTPAGRLIQPDSVSLFFTNFL